jgi:hypothetical protein
MQLAGLEPFSINESAVARFVFLQEPDPVPIE